MFGGDPVYNEIDVFEFWNEKNIFGNYDPIKSTKVHNMNIHFDYYGNGSKSSCATYYDGVDFSQDFHVFTLIWERDKIQWFVDGSIKRTDYRYYTILGQSTGCQINAWTPYIMNRIYTKDPMQIILNFAIQNGNNSPLNSTIFPSQMEIDYVKYYQRDPAQDVSIPVINTLTPENQIYSPLMINDDYIKGGISNEGHDSLFLSYSLNNSIFNQKDQELHESETNVDENIYVFPNPNSGSINVDFNLLNYKIYDIYVMDINGKTIKSINGLNSSVINIDLSSCKKGAYYLYIINNQDKNIITHKIILQ